MNYRPVTACRLLFCAATLISPGFTSGIIAQEGAEGVQRTSLLMGTRTRVQVYGQNRAEAIEASDAVLREIARVEGLISTWIPSSELSRINSLPVGTPAPLNAEVAGWLRELDQLRSQTDGAFEPILGSLIDAWNLRGTGREPTQTELTNALLAVGNKAFRINPTKNEIERLHTAAWIDAGGFGKGIALRLAADTLRARGLSGVVDLGGQLVVVGDAAEHINIPTPTDRTRPERSVRIRNSSIATSGLSERGIVINEKRLGHILNPRNGQPIVDWGVVTVVAEDPVVADVLSTALFVLGPKHGMELAQTLEGIGVLFQEQPPMNQTFEVGYRREVPGRAHAIQINEAMQELLTHNSRN